MTKIYSADELAQGLIDALPDYERATLPQKTKNELIDFMYYIEACAGNPYNNDYFRAFYEVAEIILTSKYVPF